MCWARSAPLPDWIPIENDRFLVDVGQNVGYLLHENGEFTSFPVVTGQQRTVSYIGRTYQAATPLRSWIVNSLEYKDDFVTFGKTGAFLRLSKDDNTPTPYGIHGHASAETMLASSDRYRSMGCIIVSEQVLQIIEDTFLRNGNQLEVSTVNDVVLPPPTYSNTLASLFFRM
jgi:hypothetical protein